MNKTAVILINTGTPDNYSVGTVKKYLKEFLSDKRVLDMPAWRRKLLVHGFIAPMRAKRSAKLYQKVWTNDGAPLLINSFNLKNRLQVALGNDFEVLLGMRYGNPSLKIALDKAKTSNCTNLVLLPLFPQYASSTTGSSIEFAFKHLQNWNNIPKTKVINKFYNHPDFIKSFVENIRGMQPENFEHILFSYHGLPINHVYNTHYGKPCSQFNCTEELNEDNIYCYNAMCYDTTRLIAKALDLEPERYTVAFQSRFSKNWLTPFTDKIIKKKANEGIKKLLVVSPSFVSDCLETTVEIDDTYKKLFFNKGGEQFALVPSLNDNISWIEAVKNIVLK